MTDPVRELAAGIDISVVIPCRNGSATIGEQLDALLSQRTGATFEVIVADNGSTDDTADAVRAYTDPRVRLVDASRAKGANAARNDGVAAARGPVILMTDADDIVHEGWVEAYWTAFGSGIHAAGGGLDRVLAQRGQVLARERRLYRAHVGDVSFANGTNCGFSRAAFDAVGGFDESFQGGADEVDFFWRIAEAGYTLELVAGAVVTKVQHTDLGDAFAQHFEYGRGEARLARKFRPHLLGPITATAMANAVLWGVIRSTVARVTPASRRKATCTFAWHLGMCVEGARLLEAQRTPRLAVEPTVRSRPPAAV